MHWVNANHCRQCFKSARTVIAVDPVSTTINGERTDFLSSKKRWLMHTCFSDHFKSCNIDIDISEKKNLHDSVSVIPNDGVHAATFSTRWVAAHFKLQ